MHGLSSFDLIIGAIILFLGLKGIIDGFVKEFFGLAGIIGGIYFGSRYADSVGHWISQNIYLIKNDTVMTFVGFIVGLFAIWIGMVILGSLVTKITHASGMGSLNKLLGLLFGWAKIFLIASVLVYAISSIEATKKIVHKYTKDSLLYPYLLKTGAYIIKLKPDDFIAGDVQTKSEEAKQKALQEAQHTIQEHVQQKIQKAIEHNLSTNPNDSKE